VGRDSCVIIIKNAGNIYRSELNSKFTVDFFSEPEIYEAFHQEFEFPTLSSFVDVFYIHQP